jgi:hypothetical protein
MQLALISHQMENAVIFQRASDGYVNATAMCRASGKDFYGYARNQGTQEFLQELASETGIDVSELVITITTGPMDARGTWVHPDVAINLGQWCSPKFAVAVSRWVREWISGQYRSPGLPPHIQRYIANRSAIPVTHFSMLNEMIFALIAPLEAEGYSLPNEMIPDISTGKMFCKWLRDKKDIDTDELPTYYHKYDDGRVVRAKLYPNNLLAEFRTYFYNEWMPNQSLRYFKERDPKAMEHLPKILADYKLKVPSLKPPSAE